MVITSPDQLALTPPGNPFAPNTPSSLMPLAPVVAIVIFVKTVFSQIVGFELAVPAVFASLMVTSNVPVTAQVLLDVK